jgi:hypothetical protein
VRLATKVESNLHPLNPSVNYWPSCNFGDSSTPLAGLLTSYALQVFSTNGLGELYLCYFHFLLLFVYQIQPSIFYSVDEEVDRDDLGWLFVGGGKENDEVEMAMAMILNE